MTVKQLDLWGGRVGTSRSSDYGFDGYEGKAGWGPEFHLAEPSLLEFLETSEKWTTGEAGPTETKIDLLDVVRFLPCLFWYDLTPGDVWVCRFLGSEIVEVRGNDPTGLPLEKAEDSVVDGYIQAFLDLVLKAGEPVSTMSQSHVEGREYLRAESVGLPVFDDTGRILGVIGAQVFYHPDGKRMGSSV